MADIASLGIRVTTTGAKEAAADLGQLDTASQKVEKSANTAAKAMSANAKSAKELQFATRGLPAQFTDIVTSLQGGQRPLQVLLQQGGQIKDLFGGIGPAIRAVGGYVAGLINPFTIAAAAVVGLGLAWKEAADEAQAFNLAIIQSGDYARKSADDLETLASRLDETTNATQRFASDVIAQVVASGRFTGEQVDLVSTAIINMAKAVQAAGGDADDTIKDLIKSFTDLSRDPVDALLKLNETQHFLTQSTLEQVETLKKQGREAEAVDVAIKAMADTLNARAPEMQSNLGATSIAFASLRDNAAEALDGIVDGFRRADEAALKFLRSGSLASRSVRSLLPIDFGSANDADFSGVKGSVNGGGLSIVDSKKARQDIKEVEDAQREWNSSLRQGETSAQRLKRELDEVAEAGKRLGKTDPEIAAAQDAIRDAFARKGPKARKPRKVNTRGIENASDRFDDMVGSLRAEIEGPLERVEQQHIKRMRELEQAARDGKRSHEDLAEALKLEGEAYQRAGDEVQHRYEAEIAALSGPIVQAQQAHEAALRRIEELKKEGVLTGAQYNAMLEEEAKAFEADMHAAERAADPIGALLSDMAAELDLIGKSNAERAVMVELRRQNIDAMSAEGQAALETARQFDEEAKAKQRSIDLMDDFRRGASDALSDIITGAKSAKEAFADFFDDLARRITQMIAERWIERAFGAMGTNGSGTSGGDWLGAAVGALFGGGRAMGGQVAANRVYEVGEHNQPELLQVHGRSYLIPGNQGNVTPMHGGGSEQRVYQLTQNFQVQGAPNRQTREQMARSSGREARRGMTRTGT
ncbi:Phage tail length tape-measure protein 1 [Lysobacter dokdonensis DS-58]|uniref:Phage tail length tape-measure protein 1 n=1 Tax=Lysobacter dokdonensis DS-58 TaxID=1300345 RepID=A0A0A2WIB9_9GAMM|nr:phage tail length tape measure family protein [Lysobacter dokdonensis]KGQ19936.1 Phage tail length tape-measure protein 1 [Lysobacter dokdonensis DS-58]